MKNERRYIARLDDGHDYSTIEYYSTHRAGSKANEEDCRREMRRKYGNRMASTNRIVSVYLDK